MNVRPGRDREHDLMADLQDARVALRNVDDGVLRICGLEAQQGCRGRGVVAYAHETLAHATGERRADRAPFDLELQHRQARLGATRRRLCSLQIGRCRRVLGSEPLHALELLARELVLRLGARHLGAQQGVVQPD